MPEPFGLYVHIPWCRTKCPYCDFNVVAAASWPERRYVDALIAELAHHARHKPWSGSVLRTVFLGGGTPSLFTPESVARLLDAARECCDLAADAEISLEANPESVSLESLRGYRTAGFTRVSFGVESFDPAILKRLGRAQTADDTRRCVPLAREAGFGNVSLDLMFAVPGQTLDGWHRDLDTAIAFGAEHLSAYNLTYEEGTPFFELRRGGRLQPLENDLEAAMFEDARERLAAAGYRAYEVSNFAKPGYESRHNLNYWRHGVYLGLGAGAHSHARADAGARRWSNERDPEAYASRALRTGAAEATEERLSPAQSAAEFVFLGLRLTEGFAEADFHDRFGATVDATFPQVAAMSERRLLERSGGRLRLSPRGLLLADSVLASFL